MSTFHARDILTAHASLHDRLRQPDDTLCASLEAMIEADPPSFFPFHLLPPGLAARLYAGAAARDLYGARTYLMSGYFLALAAALQFTEGEFDEYEMPSPYGFAWLDSPWPLPGGQQVIALTWGLQPVGAGDDSDGGPAGGVRLALWSRAEDSTLALAAADVLVTGQPGGGPPASLARRLWALLDTQLAYADQESGSASGAVHEPRPAPEDGSLGPTGDVVHVVRLGHPSGSHSDGGASPSSVDWQYRWLVRGHRRHAPHGQTFKDGRVTTWVHAFIKGPDDKPLKLPQTLYVADV